MNAITESGETQQGILESVIQHRFEYGLKYAMNRDDSLIVEKDNVLEFRYKPSSLQDEVWYGDCAADVLLSGKTFKKAERTIEAQQYDFSEAEYNGTHYKLWVGSKDQKIYTSIDHSKFYRSLNPMRAIKVQDTEFNNFEQEELIGDLPLTDLRNFEEFEVNGNPALSMISMIKIKNGFVIRTCIFEQDNSGNVIRKYESSYSFPSNFHEKVSADVNLEPYLHFEKILVTEKGNTSVSEFGDGTVRTKTIEAFNSTARAYLRGFGVA